MGFDLLPHDEERHEENDGGGDLDASPEGGGAGASAGSSGEGAGAGAGTAGSAGSGGAPDGGGGDAATDAGAAGSGTQDGGMQDGGMQDGGCTVVCENEHGSAECAGDQCTVSCAIGYDDCDGNPENGCEASLSDSTESCGDCVLECQNDNGSTACGDGLCSPSCAPDYDDCDGNPENGCESAIDQVDRCGTCGVSCTNAHGSTSCLGGACAPSCDFGYLDCDGDPNNGCETDSQNDPAYCGSCTNACGSNGQICVAGECEASPCGPGLGECDQDLGVTCETNIETSPLHCGFCGNACTTANGTPSCAGGSCGIESCTPGFDDCDTLVGNGCEENLATSTAHCGACMQGCQNDHGTTRCQGSTCMPTCSVGFDDCDSSRQNGCETPLDTASDCGSCNNSCPANDGSPLCVDGVCETLCDLTGTFAIRLAFQVSWAARPNVSSGAGTVVAWAKLEGTHSGNSLTGTLTDCGRQTPGFSSNLVSETYGFSYPSGLWSSLAGTNVTVTLSDSTHGATLSLPASALLMGLSMADPVNGAWPSLGSVMQVDMDSDGESGVTVQYRNGSGYTYPPTSSMFFPLPNRADSAYIAERLVFSLGGTLTSCTQASGSATVTRNNVRILGCNRSGSSTDCNGTETTFFDNNHPVYSPGVASYSMLKVAAGASCANVRSALP